MCTWIHESDAELICMRLFFSDVLTYCVMLQAFICYCSFVRCFWRARVCVCVVHWHCTAQLSMFNMEKRFRNKITIIIIIIIMERMITTRPVWHLEKNNIITPEQAGFRQHRSTEDQVTYIAQKIDDGFLVKSAYSDIVGRHREGVRQGLKDWLRLNFRKVEEES